jgi:hypothetical protein
LRSILIAALIEVLLRALERQVREGSALRNQYLVWDACGDPQDVPDGQGIRFGAGDLAATPFPWSSLPVAFDAASNQNLGLAFVRDQDIIESVVNFDFSGCVATNHEHQRAADTGWNRGGYQAVLRMRDTVAHFGG